MWYGSASNPVECFGPTRYTWTLSSGLDDLLNCGT
jgi:hypothetical protein